MALALKEPEGELEVSSIKTTAEKKGMDYLIDGRKGFVTHGSLAKFYCVFALTQPERGAEGISAFSWKMERQASFSGEKRKDRDEGFPDDGCDL